MVYAITGERRINESRRGIGRCYRGRGGLCGWTRDVGGQRQAGKEEEAGEEVGGAGEVDRRERGDGDGQDLGEEEGADHSADGADTVDCSLQLALRCGIDAAGHQGLHGGAGDAPESEEGNGAEKHPAARGEGETQEAERAEGQAGKNAAAFAEATDEGADENAGDDAGADADDGEGEADVTLGPSVAILRIEDEDGGKRLLRKIEERHNSSEAEELAMGTEEGERA